MAKYIIRHPDQPSKKSVIAKKKRNKNKILITIYIIQTLATIIYLYRNH